MKIFIILMKIFYFIIFIENFYRFNNKFQKLYVKYYFFSLFSFYRAFNNKNTKL